MNLHKFNYTVVLGCKKEVPTLYGNVTLTIPQGSESGEKLKLRDKGVEDPNSYRKGSMYVILKIVTPKKLSKDEKKIYEKLSEVEDTKSLYKNINNICIDNRNWMYYYNNCVNNM